MYIIAHIAVLGGSKVSVKVKPNAFYMGVLFCLIYLFLSYVLSFISVLSFNTLFNPSLLPHFQRSKRG